MQNRVAVWQLQRRPKLQGPGSCKRDIIRFWLSLAASRLLGSTYSDPLSYPVAGTRCERRAEPSGKLDAPSIQFLWIFYLERAAIYVSNQTSIGGD